MFWCSLNTLETKEQITSEYTREHHLEILYSKMNKETEKGNNRIMYGCFYICTNKVKMFFYMITDTATSMLSCSFFLFSHCLVSVMLSFALNASMSNILYCLSGFLIEKILRMINSIQARKHTLHMF